MFGFEKKPKNDPAGPSALTSQDVVIRELKFKMALQDARIENLENCIVEMCKGFRAHIDRIDHNTELLDKHMHQLASLTLGKPKNLLDGHNEVN